MNREALKKKAGEIQSKMQAMLDGNQGFTAEQQKEFDTLAGALCNVEQSLKNLDAMDEAKAKAEAIQNKPLPSSGNPFKKDLAQANPLDNKPVVIPAQAKWWSGRLNSFKGPDADVRAYKAGMWLAAALCHSQSAKKWCEDHGIPITWDNLHQEGVNTQGGYLVYPEFETDIIRLVEEFGLARKALRVVPMMSDTKSRPRRTGGATAYFVGEGDAITSYTGSWDNVKLIAKKLAAITTASNELTSDAIVSIADEATREIALAFAEKEDLCAFQGDGTSTYGGMFGVVQRLSALNGVDDGGGLVLANSNAYSEVVNGDFDRMIGRIPNYPGIRPEWYISKPAWAATMQPLLSAAGGNTMIDLAGPQPRTMFKGYPVNWTSGTSVLPVSAANSSIFCLFGDLRMAGDFGDRAGMTIATSTEATVGSVSMFDTDSFAIRGIERFDINIHDVGTATAAGPVVGLILAAS
jgi:HK97 family phage major capsid protein